MEFSRLCGVNHCFDKKIEKFRYSEKHHFRVKSLFLFFFFFFLEIPIFLRICLVDNVRVIDTLVAEHIANMLSLLKWAFIYLYNILRG